MKNKCWWPALLAVAMACTQSPKNIYSDPLMVRIADWQDHRQTDSLLAIFGHPDVRYRERAALALASVQDSTASNALGNLLLEDPQPSVRAVAAFALGQTKGFQSVNALIPALQDREPIVRREVLEALGKTVQRQDLYALSQFVPRDTLDEQGLSWGLYRLAVRGLLDTTLTVKIENLLRSNLSSVQLASAHALARGNVPLLPILGTTLMEASNNSSAEVRMAVASALRKFPSEETTAPIGKLLKDPDYRVRANAVRALRGLSWEQAGPLLQAALADQNVNVAIAAAEVTRAVLKKENVKMVVEWARNHANPRVQAHLFEAVLAVAPAPEVTTEVEKLLQAATNPYQKAWLLQALGNSLDSHELVAAMLNSELPLVVLTNATAALVEMNKAPQFNASLKEKFAGFYQQAVERGDPGMITQVCEALKDPGLGYRDVVKDIAFLKDARQKLQLPRDLEAVEPLEQTIAYFEGTTYVAPAKNFNHPIPWDSVQSLDTHQRVRIETNKGSIELRLLVEEAPSSVWNFVQLARNGYFDGKFFHRVVPNFVVQAGCRRGDGYGSEDYSIRSEFGRRRYQTGSVGMASAGKDTEGTQWFITHSPTPHLDGSYTIFAEVVTGMEVVHQLEVGDQIVRVALMGN